MKRFTTALVVLFGLAVAGSVVSLISQKTATGADIAPVTVMNTPAHPVPIFGTDDPARHSFTVSATCNLFVSGTPEACTPANLLTVEANQVAVVRKINASCSGTAPLAGFISLTFSNGQGISYSFATDASVPNFLFLDKEVSLFLAPAAGQPNGLSVAFAADSLVSTFSGCTVTVIGNFVSR